MKKTIITFVLAMSLLALPVFAATTAQQNTADALNSLGLLRGTGSGYALDDQLKRSDGIILLVRLIGKDAEATSGKYTHTFSDAKEDWLAPYVAYASSTGMTKGVDDGSSYGSGLDMDGKQFLTMVLRTLGYSDSGETPDFTWDKPYELAKKAGLIASTADDGKFTRGEAVEVFWNAFDAKVKGTETQFGKKLIADGAFTQSAFDAAAKIRKDGKNDASVGGGGSIGGGSVGGGSGSASGSTGYPDAVKDVTYEDFINMSGAEQEALHDSFGSAKDFFDWRNALKKEYDEEQAKDQIIIDGGVIDLEEIINGKK